MAETTPSKKRTILQNYDPEGEKLKCRKCEKVVAYLSRWRHAQMCPQLSEGPLFCKDHRLGEPISLRQYEEVMHPYQGELLMSIRHFLA
jgi:hypothetical protein